MSTLERLTQTLTVPFIEGIRRLGEPPILSYELLQPAQNIAYTHPIRDYLALYSTANDMVHDKQHRMGGLALNQLHPSYLKECGVAHMGNNAMLIGKELYLNPTVIEDPNAGYHISFEGCYSMRDRKTKLGHLGMVMWRPNRIFITATLFSPTHGFINIDHQSVQNLADIYDHEHDHLKGWCAINKPSSFIHFLDNPSTKVEVEEYAQSFSLIDVVNLLAKKERLTRWLLPSQDEFITVDPNGDNPLPFCSQPIIPEKSTQNYH